MTAWLPSIVVALVAALGAIYVERQRSDSSRLNTYADFAASAIDSPIIAKITALEVRAVEAEERASKAEQEVRDIHRDLEELQQEYERLHRLVYETQVGVAVLSPTMTYLYVNELGAQLNGIPRADHLGRTVEEALPGLWADVKPIAMEVVNQQRVKTGAFASTLPDGRPVHWAYHYAPVVRDGVTQALVANFRAISDEQVSLRDPLT